ncbi:MerR family transcriptional regulator [Bhargavaea beijingensis]|uniref:DNA-binding transcriptional regulator, MerR family n=1 Tax=Bhargavaea beijingensis TaxID=426756 RepID=A0A1G6YQQ2_9BACL|nr:MerR family transcriptional regulator [Bhargavaea beijingensis]MCW1928645.1 MerR family transcriptional regulator [Bhargavaea beijingensis]SDD92631.1 DNA-binding transcriptional regulator, MerR family [Bhargavaea beijingensis]
MVKYIGDVTKEFNIESHTLRNWEDRGLIGDVEQDFVHGRMYNEEQIERIRTIQEVINAQRERGMKRTDYREVEDVLLDRFGGLVVERQENIPATPETFINLLKKLEKQEQANEQLKELLMTMAKSQVEGNDRIHQALAENTAKQEEEIKEIREVREMVSELNKNLPEEPAISKEQADAVIKENQSLKQEVQLMKKVLDEVLIQIEEDREKQESLQAASAEEPKKGFFAKLFG